MTQPHLAESIFGDDGLASKKQKRTGPPRGRWRNIVALLLSLAVLGGGAFGVFTLAKPLIDKITASTDFEGPGGDPVTVIVNQGDSGGVIAETLVSAKVIKTTDAFLSASSDEPELAKAIQPGKYVLKTEIAAKAALSYLADPANRAVLKVTIPEGLWASEIFERLSKATKIPVKDYEAAAADPTTLGLPAAAKDNPEGWLFPATYEFDEGVSAQAQLQEMVKQAVSVMTAAKVDEADWEETMILASIVESEAGSDADRPKVARVFINRLETPGDPTYGLLQSDATVSYGAKRRAVVPNEAELADNNPYNTRVNPGLPIGPISNPGKASILASAHPAEGDWFFFVTVDPETGETKFAKTFAEHQQNEAQFLTWCTDHPGVCK